MRRTITTLAAAALLAVVVPTTAHAASKTVSVTDNVYAATTVRIAPGDSVTWDFTGSNSHSVTADDLSFDSHTACPPTCSSAGSPDFVHVFPAPGTFAYQCRVHGSAMRGQVIVDGTAPGQVTGLSAAPADGQVTLSWTNPTATDFAGVVVRRSTGTIPPTGPADGAPVYSGTGRTVTSTGLVNGTDYTFAVFARDQVSNHSTPATITAGPVPAKPTSLTIARSVGSVTYLAKLTLTGTLTRSDTGAGLSGEEVEVWVRRFGTTPWARVATVTTTSGGKATWTTIPGASADWVLRHPPNPTYAAVQTAPAPVTVRQRLGVRLSSYAIETGSAATFAVSVAPSHKGQLVQLQQYVDGAWKSVQGRALSDSSTAVFAVRPTALGTYSYRVYKGPDADHLAALTGTYRVTVVRRTLRPGMRGNDVLDVERRLAGLRYDVGAVDGVFSYDTTHAVSAFQKVQGLARTTVVDTATWSRLLGGPKAPTLRNSQPGSWVEIDLTKQVLYFGHAHRLYRVLDISSGNNKLFTVDGVTERAVTPTGTFRVERKINGWRTSRLGELYRPAYFHRGFAIHGSHSVPTQPASHGCIRITIPAMDRLYDLLARGTPLWVYYS